MRGILEEPAGLVYRPDFLTGDEHAALLERLQGLDYGEVRMHGQVARRRVRHFGTGYDFDSRTVLPGDPIPAWLRPLAGRAAELLGVPAERVVEALATYYPPGATIGWHRDAPAFGQVVGVSLGSPCALRFQLGKGAERRVWEVTAEPGSAYALTGPARTRWEHSIPAVRRDRWSITFRTLRHGWAVQPGPEPPAHEETAAGQ